MKIQCQAGRGVQMCKFLTKSPSKGTSASTPVLRQSVARPNHSQEPTVLLLQFNGRERCGGGKSQEQCFPQTWLKCLATKLPIWPLLQQFF